MCLSIVGRQRIPKAGRPVYKIYCLDEHSELKDFTDEYRGVLAEPPFQGRRFVLYADKPVKSDRRKKALTVIEKKDKEVARGIHVYLNKTNAINRLKSRISRAVLVECEGFPQHFVAQDVGGYEGRAVYMQITPRKIVAHKDADGRSSTGEWTDGVVRLIE